MASNKADEGATDPKQVHFQAPRHIVHRADVLSDALGKSRTDAIIEAMNDWVDERLADDDVRRLVATAYYEGTLGFEDLATLVGPKEANGYRALKENVNRDPREIPGPDEIQDDPYPNDFDAETTTPGDEQ